jgi:hypothetical protein
MLLLLVYAGASPRGWESPGISAAYDSFTTIFWVENTHERQKGEFSDSTHSSVAKVITGAWPPASGAPPRHPRKATDPASIDTRRTVIDLFLTCIVPRRAYRRACETAGKSGKQIERCVIATFPIAENIDANCAARAGLERAGNPQYY